MGRRKKNVAESEDVFLNQTEDRIVTTSIEDLLSNGFAKYSKAVILQRALPDASDGCKPVVRRILYAMYKDGNTYGKPYHKSAKMVGNILGNYHPHGDSSVYDALVRLSQDWKVGTPLVDMQGNNGSIDNDPSAAMRYTEARLSKLADYVLKDIDKETVPWIPNFSDELLEPTLLPTRIPLLLTMGQAGIASGYATNIPPHNLNEVINAAIHRIKNPGSTLDDIMEYVKGPDFPTGACVMGMQGIRKAFETGKGKITIRSKVSVEKLKNMVQVIVTEIPYEVVKCNMVKDIEDIRIEKKIDGILAVRDESDYKGLRIVIELKRDAPVDAILNYLYKNTDLQANYSYNMVAIVNSAPKQCGLLECLDAFIKHRETVVTNRTRYDLNAKLARMHILEGFIKAMDILDDVVHTIRASNNKSDAKNNLMAKFDFSEKQAEAIVVMRLYRLTNTDVNELQAEYDGLTKDVAFLREVLSDYTILKRVIIEELEEVVKEFPTPRKTEICGEVGEIVIDHAAMIPNEQVMLAVTRDGYFKRVSMRSYGASGDELFSGRKEDDHMVMQGEVNTRDNFIFFTKKGYYGVVPVYKIPEAKWKDLGSHITSQMKMEMDDKVVAGFVFGKENETGKILSITKQGMVKGTKLTDCANTRFTRLPVFQGLAKGDELIKAVCVESDDSKLYITTSNGLGLTYNAGQVPASGLRAKGVKGINIAGGSYVVDLFASETECDVIIGTYSGELKHIDTGYYAENNRPAKGRMLCKKGSFIEFAIPTDTGITYQVDKRYDINLNDLPKDTVTTKMRTPNGLHDKPMEVLNGIFVIQ